MQFQKQKAGSFSVVGKLLIKIFLVFFALFISVILIERIDFPSPNKKIEKILPNENFKIIK